MKSHASGGPGKPGQRLAAPVRAADGAPAGLAHFVDDYLPALLAQASHLISDEFHRVVKRKGLTVSEWRVLATLAGNQPMSIGQLARITLLQQPTVTRLLDRMESSGHVQRLEKDGDRRITLVAITTLGSRTVARLIPLAREHEQRVLEPFGLQHAERLKQTLRGIIDLHSSPPSQA
jgi:DNA-binding MarR family transcriptional regulator